VGKHKECVIHFSAEERHKSLLRNKEERYIIIIELKKYYFNGKGKKREHFGNKGINKKI